MRVIAVSRVMGNRYDTIGLGLLDVDNGEFRIVPTEQIVAALQSRVINIENVGVADGELKGLNGDISRLPVIDTQGRLVGRPTSTVINAVTNGDKTIAFDVANHNGVVGRITYNEALLSDLSNAKVVNQPSGSIISSIKGNFNTVLITEVETPVDVDTYNHIEIFNRDNLKELRGVLQGYFREIKENYGVDIRIGSMTYDANKFTARIEANILPEGKTLAEADFEEHARVWGLMEADLGREFRFKGDTYRIIGARPRARKYPIIGMQLSTGRKFVFPPEAVRNGLI